MMRAGAAGPGVAGCESDAEITAAMASVPASAYTGRSVSARGDQSHRPAAANARRMGLGRGATWRMTSGTTLIAGTRRIGSSTVPIIAR